MNFLLAIQQRIKALLRKQQLDRSMDEEMRSHIELQTQENIEAGMTPAEARYKAMQQFGWVESVKETCRDQRQWAWIEHIVQDVRYGLRMLFKNPGFTSVAVLTLALGIGANTAIFSMLNELLFRPLPVSRPDELHALVLVNKESQAMEQSISFPIYKEYTERARVFKEVIAYADLHTRMRTDHARGAVSAQFASGNYFSSLGLQPILGRTFTAEEDTTPMRDAVVVLSYAFWKSHFNSDPLVLGKTIELEDAIAGAHPFTIIGVAPEHFRGFGQRMPSFWLPVSMHSHFKKSQLLDFHIIGRLPENISQQQAEADLTAATAEIATKYRGVRLPGYEDDPPFSSGLRAKLTPAGRGTWGPFQSKRDLWNAAGLSSGVAILVLLIGCGNVANLLLARAIFRRREIAVRLSLGANRLRLFRQLLTESLLLAFLAAGVGLLFAKWSNQLLVTLKPVDVGLIVSAQLDIRVIAFAFIAALLTALLFGLAPAWQSTRLNLNIALKNESQSTAGNANGAMVQNVLVVGQMAFSLLLLIGAGLCLQSFYRLQHVDPGFNLRNVLAVPLDLENSGLKGEALASFYRQLTDRIKSIPGVVVVTASQSRPLVMESHISYPPEFGVEGYTPKPGETINLRATQVAPDYFRTLEIPVLASSGLDVRQSGGNAVWVNESFARHYWPGQSAVGKHIGPFQVQGVVKDSRLEQLWKPADPWIFMEQAAPPTSQFSLLVRTKGDPTSVAATIRSELTGAHSELVVRQIETMQQIAQKSLAGHQFALSLLGTLALTAMLLAAIGIYGVMSFIVALRTREIGVRMALGAQPASVFALILRRGMMLVLLGAVLGSMAALGLSRTLTGLLYEVQPSDPITYLGVSVFLAVVALLACWLPARRAARVDPMIALRHD